MQWVGVLAGMSGDGHMNKTERSAGDMVLFELVFVLDAFDAEERQTEQHGYGEAHEQQRSAGSLRGPDREDDGQTAADEHGGVGGAEAHVDSFAGGGEVSEIPAAVDQVSAEQAAEEHDFSGQ